MSKLGTLLVREGLLTESDRRMIHRESGTHRGSFARSVLALGVLDEHELAALFAAKTSYRIAPKNLAAEIQEDAMGLIPAHILTWLDVIPVRKANGVLYVAMTDPTDKQVLSQLEFFSGMIIKPIIASFSLIRAALKEHLSSHLDFGRSEFEDFLKNHSVSATQFATTGLTVGASAKNPAPQFASNSQNEEFSSNRQDEEFEGEVGLMSEPGGSEDLLPDTSRNQDSDDTTFEASTETGTSDDLVESMDSPSDTSESPALSAGGSDDDLGVEVMEESGSSADGAETQAASPDLDLETGDLDGDLDFDLDEDGNETPKAKVLAESPAPTAPVQASANMDEMLGGDSFDLVDDGAAESSPESAGELNTGDELGSLSLEGVDEPSLADLGDTEPSLGMETQTAGKEISPEDLLVPEDIMGGLGDDLDVKAETSVTVADEDMSLELADTDLTLAASDGVSEDLTAGGGDLALGDELPLGDLSVADDIGLDEDLSASGDLALDAEALPELAQLEEDVTAFETEDVTAKSESLDDPEIGSLDLTDLNLDAEQLLADPAADALSLDDADLNLESLDDLDVSGLAEAPSFDPLLDEPTVPQDISGTAHAGIAALNRALVNLALLSDSKKALARLADAAGQAGVESGAILALDQGALKPGVMWNRISGQNAVIPDAPAGLSLETAKTAINTAADKEGWLDLNASLGETNAKLFTSGWANAEQVPTHVLVRALSNGKTVLGFARFSGAADHDGLKQSFAELVKAAGAKM